MLEPFRFPSAIRRALLDDHARLKVSLRELERLADAVLVGASPASALAESARAFCRALDAHNAAEEAQLDELLRSADAWGGLRHEKMLIEHLEEHRELRLAISAASPLTVGLAIPLFAERLREHMEDEERTFLSAEVLRDDVVTVGPTS